MGRVNNSIKNMTTGIIWQLMQVVAQFICRTVFIQILSTEYLGLNGLFSNIISLLSLSEMGFGTALIYSMYKPLHDKDEKKMCQLLSLYKRVYEIIAFIVLVIGLSLVPFLHFFINDANDIPHIKLIYILYLLNSVFSYLFIYKFSIIEANQQNYIITRYQKSIGVVQNIAQIILLIITKDYIVYLLLQIASGILMNYMLSKKAEQMFPYIKCKQVEHLPQTELKKIISDTYALFLHRVGGVVVNSTDNILASAFVNLFTVGLYSNYLLIISNINTFTSLIFNALTASVGNLGVSTGKNKVHEVFNELFLLAFWIYGFCSVALFVLLNPFIKIWIGKSYCFSIGVVFLIVLNFYLNGTRILMRIFRDAFGLFWYFRYKSVFEALINLLFSILLVKNIGFSGILIGTTISTLTVAFWVEPYVLYKYVFNKMPYGYFISYFIKFIELLAVGGMVYYMSSLTSNNIFGFILKMLIVTLGYNGIMVLLFWNNKNFNRIKNIGIVYIKNLLRKVKRSSN